ncbi:MAG: hypothetical protein HY699_03455 [Deltaproteobacteria bacterium]|nr:hypothetical protein [Deltaproteobacteria bacterium]
MNDEEHAERPQDAVEEKVERLAREVAREINAGPQEGREILREIAVAVIREEVEIAPADDRRAAPALGSLNLFGIGIPLFLIGSVLVFLFPPIGLLFFATGGVMVIGGLGAVVVSRWRKAHKV